MKGRGKTESAQLLTYVRTRSVLTSQNIEREKRFIFQLINWRKMKKKKTKKKNVSKEVGFQYEQSCLSVATATAATGEV